MNRQIFSVGPQESRLRIYEMVPEGMCGFCQVMLEPDPIDVDLDGRMYAGCPCCGWWWRADNDGIHVRTRGQDPRCDHIEATWREESA